MSDNDGAMMGGGGGGGGGVVGSGELKGVLTQKGL